MKGEHMGAEFKPPTPFFPVKNHLYPLAAWAPNRRIFRVIPLPEDPSQYYPPICGWFSPVVAFPQVSPPKSWMLNIVFVRIMFFPLVFIFSLHCVFIICMCVRSLETGKFTVILFGTQYYICCLCFRCYYTLCVLTLNVYNFSIQYWFMLYTAILLWPFLLYTRQLSTHFPWALVPIMTQINPVPPYLFRIHFGIILPFT